MAYALCLETNTSVSISIAICLEGLKVHVVIGMRLKVYECILELEYVLKIYKCML